MQEKKLIALWTVAARIILNSNVREKLWTIEEPNSSLIVPFLTGSIPNLCLDGLVIDREGFGLKFNSNRRFRIQTEFIPGETSEKLRLANCGVTDQDDLEYVVYLLIVIGVQVRHFSHPGFRLESLPRSIARWQRKMSKQRKKDSGTWSIKR